MIRGTIEINKDFEIEYRYYEKDSRYKYFNRKFEIIILEKKPLRRNYIMHMDNADIRQMVPRIYKRNKIFDFGVTTLNWNDIKTRFIDHIAEEIGENYREDIKRAIGKLASPKI